MDPLPPLASTWSLRRWRYLEYCCTDPLLPVFSPTTIITIKEFHVLHAQHARDALWHKPKKHGREHGNSGLHNTYISASSLLANFILSMPSMVRMQFDINLNLGETQDCMIHIQGHLPLLANFILSFLPYMLGMHFGINLRSMDMNMENVYYDPLSTKEHENLVKSSTGGHDDK